MTGRISHGALPAAGAERVKTARGELEIWDLSSIAYATRLIGHMEDAHVDLFLAFSQERVDRRARPLRVFHDWLDMTGYDSVCRQRITAWTVRHLDAYGEVHVAVRSKLVAMGIEVANIALRGLVKTYGSRATLDAAMRASAGAR